MYEKTTYDTILNRMLETARLHNKNLDSREGSLLWLGQAPAAVELQNLYIALDTVLRETFADTASRDYLILRAAERGITPFPATPTVLKMAVTPVSLSLEMNARFSIGELNYYVSENLNDGNYAITCETPGEVGNEYDATVIPIEYVAGLETCVVTAVLIPGENEEDTEAFRQRYLNSLNAQAFGGNRIDYIQKVNAIPGVGGVKVYRAWNGNIKPSELRPPTGTDAWIAGQSNVPADVKVWINSVYTAAANSQLTVGGTVKLIIIDSTFSTPSETLVAQVQTTVDPVQNAGEGIGIAPIGHVVKVEGVKSESVNLSFTLQYQRDWTWEDVKGYVKNVIESYFLELAKSWAEQEDAIVVRLSQIESRMLDVSGILDISNTQINGISSNCVLPFDCIPTLGNLNASAAGG